MEKVHNFETDKVAKMGWTPVTLNTMTDGEITSWLQNQPGGRYIEAYFARTFYFENEQDALLFKLKFGSYKGKFNNPFGIDFGDMDINSMYPTTINVLKPRSMPTQQEFQQMYMGDFIYYDCEGSVDKERLNDLYSGSTSKKKVRS